MCTTPNPNTKHLRLLLMAAFVLCAAVSGFAQSKSVENPIRAASKDFVLQPYKGVAQSNTLADQIVRAEFYQAQYAHDAATQAKYQSAIDDLKKQLAVQNAPTKKD